VTHSVTLAKPQLVTFASRYLQGAIPMSLHDVQPHLNWTKKRRFFRELPSRQMAHVTVRRLA
jgi:hypothetical protein